MQWWAPVWKGLVMDTEAKHYRKMKNAVWLYLYLLLNARRGAGVLMRKTRTISRDMGVSRDNVLRWLNVLREEGYIATQNTGRYLTIQVQNWKPLTRRTETRPQMSGSSDTSSWKYPTPSRPRVPPFPDHSGPKPGASGPPNKREINKLLNNETQDTMQHATAHDPGDRAFKTIGSCAHQELLAWELAKALDDPAGIGRYRSCCRRYPEELLRKVLSEVNQAAATRTKEARLILFNHLLQHYAQGTTENPGS